MEHQINKTKKKPRSMSPWFFEVIIFLFTKAWGHLLIPAILGTIFWAGAGFWLGWSLFMWIVWLGSFLVIGWILTVAAWVRYYWNIYKPK